MNSNSIIVSEYLASLKEDSELDYLFPMLLNIMGYRIAQTALLAVLENIDVNMSSSYLPSFLHDSHD